MKTKSWMSVAAFMATILLGSSCSSDWGKSDPPAATDVYPTLEAVVTYAFDAPEELDPLMVNLFAYPDGVMPSLVEDELAKSPVLDLSSGYARFANPMAATKVQKAVSLTFWMKQMSEPALDEDGEPILDAEGNPTYLAQDLTSPLLHWENENASATLDFNANGGWNYNGLDGTWVANDPAAFATGYITPNQWHYVAMTLRNDGYGIYVDGEKKADVTVSDFDLTNAVQFMAQAPHMYINYGADTHTSLLIEDLTFYRNIIEAKQIAAPRKGNINGGSTGGNNGPDLSKWIMVGEEDNSNGFWQVFSDPIDLTGDGTIHYEFYNYGGTENWHNWVLVITSGGGPGNTEHIVLRADNYGWGTLYDSSTLTCDYNWDSFKEDMKEAYVSIDVVREGNDLTITAVTETKDGKTYNYKIEVPGIPTEKIGTFFTLENAHLLFNPDAAFVGRTFSGEYTLGNKDKTSTFWSCWTPVEAFDADFTNFGFEFVNHHGTGNFQGWNLVVTNGKQSPDAGDGYAEQLYLRCDNYGWADRWDQEKTTCSFDWTTYVDDMTDATCRVYFAMDATGSFSMLARQTTADGRAMPEYRFDNDGFTFPVGLIFTCEGAWLDFSKIGYFPWVDMKKAQ